MNLILRFQKMNKNLSRFIDEILIHQLDAMIRCGAGYLAFGQISIGIEFLGACHDSFDFEEPYKSRERFKLGITEYMAKIDPRYATYNDAQSPYYLYKHLRCGMAHLVRPQGKVGLTGGDNFTLHLREIKNPDAIILVLNPFFEDFKKACAILKSEIPNLSHPKISQIYLPSAPVFTEIH